jgi:hypothetical protein
VEPFNLENGKPLSDVSDVIQFSIKGFSVLIDRADLERVQKMNWTMTAGAAGFAIKTRIRCRGVLRKVTLQRFVIGSFHRRIFLARRHGTACNDFRKSAFKIFSKMSERQAYLDKTKRRTTSRFKGVSYSKRAGKWRASIRPRSDSIFLGEFESEIEAALAYNKAALKYFGADAFQNDVTSSPDSRRVSSQ